MMMKYRVKKPDHPVQNIEKLLSDKMLTAPEAGVYSIL